MPRRRCHRGGERNHGDQEIPAVADAVLLMSMPGLASSPRMQGTSNGWRISFPWPAQLSPVWGSRCVCAVCDRSERNGSYGNCSNRRYYETHAEEFRSGDLVCARQALFRLVVKTRHGFHIVAVDRRIPGKMPFEVVCDRIAERLKASVEEQALRQYVSILAGEER
jgi:hypothetical protein